jgi:hypothetical protein
MRPAKDDSTSAVRLISKLAGSSPAIQQLLHFLLVFASMLDASCFRATNKSVFVDEISYVVETGAVTTSDFRTRWDARSLAISRGRWGDKEWLCQDTVKSLVAVLVMRAVF